MSSFDGTCAWEISLASTLVSSGSISSLSECTLLGFRLPSFSQQKGMTLSVFVSQHTEKETYEAIEIYLICPM